MNLIPEASRLAAEIDGIHRETIAYLRAQAARSFALANTPGQQQPILDAFGNQASDAIGVYIAIHGLLSQLGAADGLPAPDTAVFQSQPDGSVIYSAPAEPAEPATPEAPAAPEA